jgi:hypothetical protein
MMTPITKDDATNGLDLEVVKKFVLVMKIIAMGLQPQKQPLVFFYQLY